MSDFETSLTGKDDRNEVERPPVMKRVEASPRVAAPSSPKRRGERRPSGRPFRIAGAGIDIRFAEVDNPYYSRDHAEDRTNPKRVQAARNVNESALVRLEALGTIDAAQAAAGHKFRAIVERLMAGQASPSDIKEHVDGGAAPDIFTEGRMRASFQLRRAAEQLTRTEYLVLHFVCGEGRSLNELAVRAGCRKTRVRIILVSALDHLAEIWNLKPANDGRAPSSR